MPVEIVNSYTYFFFDKYVKIKTKVECKLRHQVSQNLFMLEDNV